MISGGPDLPRVALAMQPDLVLPLLGPDGLQELAHEVDLFPNPWHDRASIPPPDTEVLLSCWGCPPLDADALDRLPELRAVIHGAGSIKEFASPALFDRGVLVSTAADANAEPVAEYTLAAIIFAGKRLFQGAQDYRDENWTSVRTIDEAVGNYGLRVGIVGASRVGRRVIELLRPLDVRVAVYDPFLREAIPGTTLLSLDELLRWSDVVSLHAPALPTTDRMIDRSKLAQMRDGATLINTARGSLVDQEALVDELDRGRLFAVLDVTDEEPPGGDRRLLSSRNAFVTPHSAGSQGRELRRLGTHALAELRRFVHDGRLAHGVDESMLDAIA